MIRSRWQDAARAGGGLDGARPGQRHYHPAGPHVLPRVGLAHRVLALLTEFEASLASERPEDCAGSWAVRLASPQAERATGDAGTVDARFRRADGHRAGRDVQGYPAPDLLRAGDIEGQHVASDPSITLVR